MSSESCSFSLHLLQCTQQTQVCLKFWCSETVKLASSLFTDDASPKNTMLKETSSGWIQIDPTEPKLWRRKVVFFFPNCYFFVHLSQLHQNEYSLIFMVHLICKITISRGYLLLILTSWGNQWTQSLPVTYAGVSSSSALPHSQASLRILQRDQSFNGLSLASLHLLSESEKRGSGWCWNQKAAAEVTTCLTMKEN